MFNTYQELVDRIEELLQEREILKYKIERLEYVYSIIPLSTIRRLYSCNEINREEFLLWLKVKTDRERSEKSGKQSN